MSEEDLSRKSCEDSYVYSECKSYVTASTDSTTLRTTNRNLRLTIETLKNTIDLLSNATLNIIEGHADMVEKRRT